MKWTLVGIYEAPDAGGAPGAFVELEEQALPGYADATDPPVFDLETILGSAPSGLWYRVQFRDPVGGLQDGVPEYNGTSAVPETEWIRETSKADFDDLGYPAPGPGEPDPLQVKLDEAVSIFRSITAIDAAAMSETDPRLTLVRMALRMLVEYECAARQMEQLETASDFDMISAMSASDYSETRRGLTRQNPQTLHPWPALDRLLGAILSFGLVRGSEAAPGISVPGACPTPYQEVTIERAIRSRRLGYEGGYPGPVVGPVWPGGGA